MWVGWLALWVAAMQPRETASRFWLLFDAAVARVLIRPLTLRIASTLFSPMHVDRVSEPSLDRTPLRI